MPTLATALPIDLKSFFSNLFRYVIVNCKFKNIFHFNKKLIGFLLLAKKWKYWNGKEKMANFAA